MKKLLLISFVFSFFIIGILVSASEETKWKNTTCNDTDGGSNPYVFGKVTLTNPPSDGTIPNLSDMCYSSLIDIHGDSCTGEGCQVMENYCVDINDDNIDEIYNSTYFNCPNGCNKGACITVKNTNPTIKVLSPKGGEKYETGQQIFVKWETENISEDNKNFSITLQGYNEDGIVASSYELATNTINDGEEVVTLPKKFTSPVSFGQNFTMSIETHNHTSYDYVYAQSKNKFTIKSRESINENYYCKDTDNGYNIYKKGVVTWGATGITEKLTNLDSCVEETVKSTQINEYGCIDDKSYSEVFTCPNGCSNGACISNNKLELKDLTPRISYWQGKVNQHVDVDSKEWQTDPDGVSGAEIDKLDYCKKWYPLTESVRDYKKETIKTWRKVFNEGEYKSEKMSYECVLPSKVVPELPGGYRCYSLLEPVIRTLKIGVTGSDVKSLQRLLGITEDGVFGKITSIKVKEWQKLNGLKQDGIFGSGSIKKSGLTYEKIDCM